VPIRAIGLGGVLLVATNGMIGTGIFALPGKLDAAVGMFAPLLLALAGLGFICIALSFADCARHFDRSGGQVLYVGTAFGRFPGFLTGWLSYVARSSSQAANANVLAVTAAALFPLAASSAGRAVLIILLIGALTALNVIGVRKALAAIAAAHAIIIGPSNPVISIGPILTVPEMRQALLDSPAPIVAVSPIVGGAVLKGPTAAFMRWAGHDASSAAVAACYAGLIDGLVADEPVDGLPVLQTDTLMSDAAGRRRVASETLSFAQGLAA